jgi:hypothetical protein
LGQRFFYTDNAEESCSVGSDVCLAEEKKDWVVVKKIKLCQLAIVILIDRSAIPDSECSLRYGIAEYLLGRGFIPIFRISVMLCFVIDQICLQVTDSPTG